MNNNKYEALKLSNQLCFPLYAVSKEIIRRYKPFLDRLDLTYTQYITMLLLWERGKMNVSSIGKELYLDSGTLSPVLKKLDEKGYVKRERTKTDERSTMITLTDKGESLKEKAADVPIRMGGCINISKDDAAVLYRILYSLLDNITTEDEE